MRPFATWAAFGLFCCLAAGAVAQETEFPYKARVLANDVYVRSGPGKSYYPTDKLSSGDVVEVYRHDPGGWLAIRPPEGSFSWVSARFLRPIENGLGEVTGEAVVSRVGSRFSNVRDAIQVRLEKGEQVVLIEEQTSQGQSWYKIAPPSGEFRWISASYVNRELSANGVSEPRSLTRMNEEGQYAEYHNDLSEVDVEELAAARAAIDHRLAELQAEEQAAYEEPADASATSPVALAQYQAPPTVRAGGLRPRENTARLAPPVAAERSWAASGAGSATGAAKVRSKLPPGGLNFSAELATIDLDLSAMVAEEPTTWVFDEISARLEVLQAVASTAIQRGEVRAMQQKVASFEELRQRRLALAAGRSVGAGSTVTGLRSGLASGAASAATTALTPGGFTPGRNTALAPVASAAGSASETTLPFLGAAAGSATAPSEFDGQGTLRPVVSKRPDAPRFALVDEAGNVASFVTPAPGLNLQPYVGEKVGLIGTRGFMQELRKPHVMAKRVSLLETTRR